MTRHGWVGKVIHWELCKKLKFDHSKSWHMHKLEPSRRMKDTKFSGILRDEQITFSQPDDLDLSRN